MRATRRDREIVAGGVSNRRSLSPEQQSVSDSAAEFTVISRKYLHRKPRSACDATRRVDARPAISQKRFYFYARVRFAYVSSLHLRADGEGAGDTD